MALVAVLGLAMSAAVGSPASTEPGRPSAAELATVHAAVGRTNVDGIAWYTDPGAGRVVVTVDSTVSATERSRLRNAAGADANLLVVKRVAGAFKPLLGPGDRIFGSGVRCSVGFNVRRSGKHYLLTAGHCGDKVSLWYTNSSRPRRVGPTVGSSYPGNDYALVRYTRALKHPGGYSAAKARVGQKATRDGTTSGRRSGTVTAINVNVRYVGGVTMRDMIQANICAEPGDSGGPLYSRSKAFGITSGGSGSCRSGGTTFYQPIIEALAAYHVRIY
jgi:streptogrisin B